MNIWYFKKYVYMNASVNIRCHSSASSLLKPVWCVCCSLSWQQFFGNHVHYIKNYLRKIWNILQQWCSFYCLSFHIFARFLHVFFYSCFYSSLEYFSAHSVPFKMSHFQIKSLQWCSFLFVIHPNVNIRRNFFLKCIPSTIWLNVSFY